MQITIFGGGTGTSNVLRGLKPLGHNLSVVSNMVDNGGSTGKLRKQLGVLPPGDVRQTLLALSNAPREIQDAFAHRFQQGDLKSHVLGNILLAGMEASGMDFRNAVKRAGSFLQVEGSVHPVTTDNVQLEAKLEDGTIITGQVDVHHSDLSILKELRLNPAAHANPDALEAIKHTDVLIISPGDFYSSIAPIFLVNGIREAVAASSAPLISITNLVTKPGHTAGWDAHDFACALEVFCGRKIDTAIYQDPPLSNATMEQARAGEERVAPPKKKLKTYFAADIAAKPVDRQTQADTVVRNAIMHDPKKTVQAIQRVLETL